MMVSLRYLSNFWRILKIPCFVKLRLCWPSQQTFLVTDIAENQNHILKITDAKFNVPLVTSSTQDNVKLLKQLQWGFTRTINRNKNQSRITEQTGNRCFNVLIDPTF